MSKQISLWRTGTTISNVATSYNSLLHGGGPPNTTAEYRASQLIAAAGTIRNLKVKLSTAPTGGDSWAFAVMLNGSPTSLGFTIASGDDEEQDTSNTVTVAVGDVVSLRIIPSGSPTSTGMRVSCDFDSTTAGESQYGGASHNTVTTTRNEGFFNLNHVTWQSTSSGQTCPIAGTVTRLVASLDASPSPGTYTFTIYKNGVAQDGSGGTPDTRLTLSSTTISSTTFSLSVAAGDLLHINVTLAGSPTAVRPRVGVNFIASTPGYSVMAAELITSLNNSDVAEYWRPYSWRADNSSATETTSDAWVGVSGFVARNLYVRTSGAAGVGNTYTFMLRKNAGDTTLTTTISGTSQTTNNDGGGTSASYATGDAIDLKQQSTSNPSTRTGAWSYIQDATAHEVVAGGGGDTQCIVAGA